jgi:uncharacterized membrane protein
VKPSDGAVEVLVLALYAVDRGCQRKTTLERVAELYQKSYSFAERYRRRRARAVLERLGREGWELRKVR